MKWVDGRTIEKFVFVICPKSVYLDLSLMYLLLFPIQSPFFFEITPFLYLETRTHQWPRKLGFFRVLVMEREPRFAVANVASQWRRWLRSGEGGFAVAKVASQWRRWLRSGEGGFAVVDLRPLISGFLVCCGEGTLHCSEPVALCWSTFLSFLFPFCFPIF